MVVVCGGGGVCVCGGWGGEGGGGMRGGAGCVRGCVCVGGGGGVNRARARGRALVGRGVVLSPSHEHGATLVAVGRAQRGAGMLAAWSSLLQPQHI